MHLSNPRSRRNFLAGGIVAAICAATGVFPRHLAAAEVPTTTSSGSGTFISFRDGTLTIKGKSGLVDYRHVGKDYRTFRNNEDGPGCEAVDTVEALGQLVAGSAVRVDVDKREIVVGLDHRVIGTSVSYGDGKLELMAAAAPPGFLQKPAGRVVLRIDPGTPVLESIAGGAYRFAGPAEKALKSLKPETFIVARSESDADTVDVVQIGDATRKIERYAGQSRGPVRGTFVSFQNGMLQILGRGVTSLVAADYDRLMRFRIADDVPVFESIDGDEYQPAGTAEALTNVKEGTIVTIRKAEEVVIDIRIGVAKNR